MARLLERLPHRLQEQLDIGASDAVRMPVELLQRLRGPPGWDAQVGELAPRPRQPRRALLVAVLAEGGEQAQLDRTLQQLAVAGLSPTLCDLVRRDDLRRLLAEGVADPWPPRSQVAVVTRASTD
jgi:hypothetical protein